jgi:hypothetical protein
MIASSDNYEEGQYTSMLYNGETNAHEFFEVQGKQHTTVVRNKFIGDNCSDHSSSTNYNEPDKNRNKRYQKKKK